MFVRNLVTLEADDHCYGHLDRFSRLALERRLAVFLTLLEPVMILLVGGVVLMIVLAILLPIIEINQLGTLSGTASKS